MLGLTFVFKNFAQILTGCRLKDVVKMWWKEFEFNWFKKVLDSIGQRGYHNIVYVVKNKKFKTLQTVSHVKQFESV